MEGFVIRVKRIEKKGWKRNIPEEICVLDQRESLKQQLVEEIQCSKPTHYASDRDVANIGAVEDD
jgi:hypothetical protein